MAVHICQNPQKCALERIYFTVCKLHVNFKNGTKNKTDHIILHEPVQWLLVHCTMVYKALCQCFSNWGLDTVVGQKMD